MRKADAIVSTRQGNPSANADRDSTHQPTIIFLCVHRGGSSFIANAFADVVAQRFPGLEIMPLGSLVEQGRAMADLALTPTGVLATRVYPEFYDSLEEHPAPSGGRFAGKRLILMRRDPRDVAVSWYYSAAFSHPIPPNIAEAYTRRRAELQQLGPLEGIRLHTARDAIDEFKATIRFLEQYPRTCEAPYELLVTDCRAWLDKVITHLNWPRHLIDELTPIFAEAVKPPEREDPHAHRRRITPGNWRAVFDHGLCELFDRELGESLTNAGYTWDSVALRP